MLTYAVRARLRRSRRRSRWLDSHAHGEALACGQDRGAEAAAVGEDLVEGLHGRDDRGARARGLVGELAEEKGVVGEDEAARAQVVGGPVEVVGVALLVGVDEAQVERLLGAELGEDLRGRAEVDARLRRVAGAAEALARDLGVTWLDLDGVEDAADAHAAQERDARVAAQRADLDGAARARDRGEHLEVAGVERADLDVGQAFALAALADLAQDVVFGRVGLLDVRGDALVVVSELLVHALTLPRRSRRVNRDSASTPRRTAAERKCHSSRRRLGAAAAAAPAGARPGRWSSARRAGFDSAGARLTTKLSAARSTTVPSAREARTR